MTDRDKRPKTKRNPLGAGRHTYLTPPVQEAIVSWIKSGNTIETACALEGIQSQVFRLWMKRGGKERARVDAGGEPNSEEAIFAAFVDEVRKAESRPKALAVRAFTDASAQDWQAARDWLKVRFPKEWSERVWVTITQELEEVHVRLERARKAGVFDDEVYRKILETIAGDDGAGASAPVAGDDPK